MIDINTYKALQENIYMNVGQLIKKKRQEKKIKISELANVLHIPITRLKSIESGEIKLTESLSMEQTVCACLVLEIPIEDIINIDSTKISDLHLAEKALTVVAMETLTRQQLRLISELAMKLKNISDDEIDYISVSTSLRRMLQRQKQKVRT